MEAIKMIKPLRNTKQVWAFLGVVDYYHKFYQTCQTAFDTLKGALIRAPILHCSDPSKCYVVYTDASDDACRAQLPQEHNRQELPVTFFSHTFTETHWKWSIHKQEADAVYYTITKLNYYLQGSDIMVRNDHKPLQKFVNEMNANAKVNHKLLELAMYNVTFEWISDAHNKAAECLLRLVEGLENDATASSILMNVVTASPTDGPTTCTCSKTNTPVVTPK